MMQKIEEQVDYYTRIKENPIELLRAIKTLSMSYHEKKHHLMTTSDALRAFATIKQGRDELLIDYAKRFKAANVACEACTARYGSLFEHGPMTQSSALKIILIVPPELCRIFAACTTHCCIYLSCEVVMSKH